MSVTLENIWLMTASSSAMMVSNSVKKASNSVRKVNISYFQGAAVMTGNTLYL